MPAIRTITSRLTLPVFLLAVLTPVLLFGYDGPWLGPGDIAIRGKAPFPAKMTPGSFKDFDTWFADRVGLRYPLIYAGTELHVGILRRPLDRHIFFGRDGFMFWTDNEETIPATMADARGKLHFTKQETDRIDRQLRAIRDRFAACGLPAAIMIVPNKQTIYEDSLFGAGVARPATRLDALLATLSEPARAMIIDPRASMQDAKRAQSPILLYPKTESHWNELGAFYGYIEILRALRRSMPISNFELTDLANYRVMSEPYAGGDMATRVLFSPWRFPDSYVRLEVKGPAKPIEQIEVDHEHTLYRNPQGKGRLVLFGDSFAHALMPFLAQNFAEVHRHTSTVFNGSIIAKDRPDAVVLETVERYLGRLLEPQIDLARICEKPAVR